jgi:hypothetical protein
MLILRDDQLTLTIADEESFANWYVDSFMPEHLAIFCEELDRDTRKKRVIFGRRKAIKKGFTQPMSHTHFVTLMWDIGPGFFYFPGYKEIAEAIDQPEADRINRFYDDITDEQDKAATLGADENAWNPDYQPPETKQGSE